MTPAEQDAALSQTLDGLGELLSDLCAAPVGEESLVALDAQSSRFWRSFHALKQRMEDRTLSCAILALAKSGKSTLLNALIGRQLLPMNNVPETARICRIVHIPGSANVEPYLVEPTATGSARVPAGCAAQGTVTARGEAAVRSRLQELNHAARVPGGGGSSGGQGRSGLTSAPSLPARYPSLPSASSGGLDGLVTAGSASSDAAASTPHQVPDPNGPPVAAGLSMDKVISIHTPVAALLEYEGGAAATGSGAEGHAPFRLQLLDTPGPNEAGEEGLRHQVERLLDGVDAAVYLLDYTKLKTADEAGLFERLKCVNPALLARLAQRLFFVVNKVDAAEVSEGQDLEETREYVAGLVTRQVDLPGFRLRPDQVLLLSARNALLSRLILRGDATPEIRARFAQLAFGRFANPALIPQDQLRSAAAALLQDSSIQDLEAQVLGYLHTHAASLKRLALVDDLGRLLAEVQNVAASCAGALSRSAEVLAARVEEVRGQLDTALAAFEAVGRDADAIGEEVAREVRAHLHTLRGRLFSAIINTLDTSGGAAAPRLPEDAAAAAAACDTPLSRRWRGVRERFLSIFTGHGSHPPPPTHSMSSAAGRGGAQWCGGERHDASDADGGGLASRCDSAALLSAAGGAVARSQSKAELAALLVALHEDVTAQIHAEVCDFWGVMEAVAGARHAELLATLNTALDTLSRQVEAVVARGLGVVLTPVSLRLDPPDASQFHADLEDLLARGVVETRERHIRVSKREVQERVLRRGGGSGICRWGDYWESVPRVRTVVEAYTLATYELVPTHITQHFITMIDQAIDVTQASLSAYVSQFVSQQLAEARHQLHEYSSSYLLAMSAALDASTRGSEHRNAALGQVNAFVERIRCLAAQRDTLQRSLDAGVPRALGGPIAFNELDELLSPDEESEEQVEEGESGLNSDSQAMVQEAGEDNGAEVGQAVPDPQAGAAPPASPVPSTATTALSGAGLATPFACDLPPLATEGLTAAATPEEQPTPTAHAGSRVWASPSPHGTSAALEVTTAAASGGFPGSPASGTTGSSTLKADALLHAPLTGGAADQEAAGERGAMPSAPSLPFDYASGFVSAMSSSHLEASRSSLGLGLGPHGHDACMSLADGATPLGETGSEDWDLVAAPEEGDRVDGEEDSAGTHMAMLAA